jgi:hypothetical protein
MKETRKTKKILQEWDVFCNLLLEGTKACDSGKSLRDYQTEAPYPASYDSEMLDLYLRMTFEPPADGIPPDIFEETPPVLEKALVLRIVHATAILTKILETHDGPELQSESDLAKATHLFFRDLLLPSSPEIGSYTLEKTV